MTTAKRPNMIEPIPEVLLKTPLLWIFAEHYRHRYLCQRLMDLLAPETFDQSLIHSILYFLEEDLELHIIDEEHDFFPLLRKRCEPDDQIDDVLQKLSGDHDDDIRLANQLTRLLKTSLLEQSSLKSYDNGAAIVEQFCTSQKRHIGIENAVILPIARLRLTEADLKLLGQQMAERRNLSNPFIKAS